MGHGRRRTKALIAGLVVAVTSSACAGPPRLGDRPLAGERCSPPSGEHQLSARPVDVALDPAAVARAVAFASGNFSSSVRVYRHDCLVATSATDPDLERVPANIYSATKTVLALVVGRAVTLGHLRLDDTVGTYFPEADAAHARITVRDLLTQSSGLRFAWVNEVFPGPSNGVRYALSVPFAHEPGTYFEYSQVPLTLLAELVTRATGQDVQTFADREVFSRIGIPRARWTWNRDPSGLTYGYSELAMAPVDLAAVGSLMLHAGTWNGERLIDDAYMAAMRNSSATNPGYGFLTWTNQGETYFDQSLPVRPLVQRRIVRSAPADMFEAYGSNDQFIVAIPSVDLVVVRTGGAAPAGAAFLHEFLRLLLGGVEDRELVDPGPFVPDPAPPAATWDDLRKFFDPELPLGG